MKLHRPTASRRGIVLLITLAILLLVSGILFLFLKESDTLKASVRRNLGLIQTNLILHDLSAFLKTQSFSQEDVFYGAGIPVALEIGTLHGTLTIDPVEKRININRLLKTLLKKQEALDAFLDWLDRKRLKNPRLLLALLLDTYDKDLYEREPQSEIRLERPSFQNGSIPNSRAMAIILDTYSRLADDPQSLQSWEEVFGYDGDTIDLNYATVDQLTLLFPDLSQTAILQLAAHNNWYETFDDLPLDEEEKQLVQSKRLGMTPSLTTHTIAARIAFTTDLGCRGSLGFRMALKKKTISFLSLSPLRCDATDDHSR